MRFRRPRGGRGTALAAAVVAVFLVSACASDPAPSGPRASTPTTSETPATPGPSPTASTGDGEEPEPSAGVDLCEALDRRALSRITGLDLRPGTFDGVRCTWEADGGSLIVGQQPAFHTAGHIARLQTLDVGQAVEIAGAKDAVAVTVRSGPDRGTKISLLAKVGELQVFVVLRSEDPTLDEVVRIAELLIGR